MRTGLRRLLIGIALAATLATVWWAETEAPSDAAPKVSPRKATRPTGVTEVATLPGELRRPDFATQAPDAFAPRSWRPPPPPIPVAKPEPPSAPPLPFQYIGKLVEGTTTTVFLARGAQNLSVKVGENIDGQYRLDAVGTAGVTLTYLPLAQKQTLSLGTPN